VLNLCTLFNIQTISSQYYVIRTLPFLLKFILSSLTFSCRWKLCVSLAVAQRNGRRAPDRL